MKARLLITAFMVTAAICTEAAPVTRTAARATARSFMKKMGMGTPAEAMAKRGASITSDDQPYYIVNVQGGDGYVIVAGDDLATPVLGYGTEGNIDMDNMPPAMAAMLKSYEKQMEWVRAHNNVLEDIKAEASGDDTNNDVVNVAPLLGNIAWGQFAPANDFTPMVHDSTEHAPVGCVATAMSQVMYKWRWPQEACKPIPAYRGSKSDGYEVYSIDTIQPARVFDWDALKDRNYQNARNGEMAWLSLYCGQSVKMGYDLYGSGAYTRLSASALINYFNYDPGITYEVRDAYTSSQWHEMVLNEMLAGRPVIYNGVDELEYGHAFVIDGYSGEDRTFHVNWGWDGSLNGYFVLDVLNTVTEFEWDGHKRYDFAGTYSNGQAAVMGIQPRTSDDAKAQDARIYVSGTDVTSRNQLRSSLSNPTGNSFHGKIYYVVTNLATNGKITISQTVSLPAFYTMIYITGMEDKVKDMMDGEYKITVEGADRANICNREGIYFLMTVKDGKITKMKVYPDALYEDEGVIEASLSLKTPVVIESSSSFRPLTLYLTVKNNSETDTWTAGVDVACKLYSTEMLDTDSLMSELTQAQLKTLAKEVKTPSGYTVSVEPGISTTLELGASGLNQSGTYVAVATEYTDGGVVAATAFYVYETDPTGINDVQADVLQGSKLVYDLQGRRVSTTGLDALPHGLYVVDGKKVVK